MTTCDLLGNSIIADSIDNTKHFVVYWSVSIVHFSSLQQLEQHSKVKVFPLWPNEVTNANFQVFINVCLKGQVRIIQSQLNWMLQGLSSGLPAPTTSPDSMLTSINRKKPNNNIGYHDNCTNSVAGKSSIYTNMSMLSFTALLCSIRCTGLCKCTLHNKYFLFTSINSLSQLCTPNLLLFNPITWAELVHVCSYA